MLVAAIAVGLPTGFSGVGSGFLVVPALVLDFPMPVTVGTSLLVIAMNSGRSPAARAGGGIDFGWTIVGVFTAVAGIGGPLGARIEPGAVRKCCGSRSPC